MNKLLSIAIIFVASLVVFNPDIASAESKVSGGDFSKVLVGKEIKSDPKKKQEKKEVKPEPVQATPVNPVYNVIAGDNLTKIATANNTTVERLWEKNTDINHPDFIDIDDKIIIPLPEEVLATRSLPQAVVVTILPVSGGSTDGNTYTYGYCTWYVKNMRPDIPNSWGNASSWYGKAQASGYAVSSVPKVGAVAWRGGGEGHVAIVTGVSGDTITISEMNHEGWNIVSSRSTASSSFLYIY